jgi:hypothetical protein
VQIIKPYKRPRRTAVELTSLLDLLFVMIFVSLMQQKNVTETPPPVTKVVPQETQATKASTPQKVNFAITATFIFYGTTQNPNLPRGSYVMQGTYSTKTKQLKLGGVGWLERPENYDMVPLSGVINDSGTLFTGRIEFIGCEKFTLKRVSKGSASPLSGDWKGSYDCSQGFTGLTLSIE